MPQAPMDFGSALLDTTGPQATGWQTHVATGDPGWRWTAYGPGGNEAGTAATREEAERHAQEAHARLAQI